MLLYCTEVLKGVKPEVACYMRRPMCMWRLDTPCLRQSLPHPPTHPTCLLRRYADVVVHRQLLAAVAAEAAALPPPLAPPLPGAELADKAGVMNERHRTAKRAQKECSDLYLLLLLHSQVLLGGWSVGE